MQMDPESYYKERQETLNAMPKEQAELQQQNEALMSQAKRDGNEGNLRMGEGGKMVLMDEWSMGSQCERYAWGQTEQEILIKVPVPAGTKSKAIKFDVTSAKLKLQVLADTILSGELHKKVVPDDCTFVIEDAPAGQEGRQVVVTLQKLKKTSGPAHWKCVCEGEPEIDVSQFGPAIMTANPNDPSGIASMLADSGLG